MRSLRMCADTLFVRLLAVVVGIACVLAVMACSSDNDQDDSSGNAGSESKVSDGAYYPHTMAGMYGDVTIKNVPKRVVAIGTAAASDMLSLGITPAAVGASEDSSDRSWWGGELDGLVHSELVTNTTVVHPEAVALLDPDLILVGTYYAKDKDQYDQLSAIAPTITQYEDGEENDWRLGLHRTAEALNSAAGADSVIDEIEDIYLDLGDILGNPRDLTYSAGVYNAENGQWRYSSVQVGMQMSGMKMSEGMKNPLGEDGKSRAVSLENISEIDADLILVMSFDGTGKDALEANGSFRQMRAVKLGNVYWADDSEKVEAVNSASPHTLRWLANDIKPTIERMEEE